MSRVLLNDIISLENQKNIHDMEDERGVFVYEKGNKQIFDDIALPKNYQYFSIKFKLNYYAQLLLIFSRLISFCLNGIFIFL